MRKNKKGFTLIELLAIIVILAIIAVITVPIILNIIDNSKKGAKIDSAYGYKDAVQNYYLSKNTNDTEQEPPTGTYDISDLPDDFEVGGEEPSAGWVTLEKGKVVAYSLQFDDYVVTKNNDSEPVAEKNGTLAPSPALKTYEIGDTVNYSTSLNGVTLNSWKLFYREGDYAYLILSEYLPNDAIEGISGISKDSSGVYGVYSGESRAALINALTNKSNWDSLLTGTIDGKTINETRNDNVWAIGSPTIQLFMDSWNSLYPENMLYISEETGMSDSIGYGYYVGTTENPTASSNASITSASGTMFAPRVSDVYATWFASPAAKSPGDYYEASDCVLGIQTIFQPNVWSYRFNAGGMALRPMIRLPYNDIR